MVWGKGDVESGLGCKKGLGDDEIGSELSASTRHGRHRLDRLRCSRADLETRAKLTGSWGPRWLCPRGNKDGGGEMSEMRSVGHGQHKAD